MSRGLWLWSGNEESVVPVECAFSPEEGTAKLQQDQDHVNVLFDWEAVVHHEYAPVDQIINMEYYLNVLLGWEMQYNENGHSYGQLVIDSFIMTTLLLMHHISCSVFLWNIKSPRWLSPATTQI